MGGVVERCEVCGAPATHEWGSVPLCDNPVCEQITQDEANFALQEAGVVHVNKLTDEE